jgi:hypothetical protein
MVGLRKRLHLMLTFVACGTGLFLGLGSFAQVWALPLIMRGRVCGEYPAGTLAESVREGIHLKPSEWQDWLKVNVETACKLFIAGIVASVVCYTLSLVLIAAFRRDPTICG